MGDKAKPSQIDGQTAVNFISVSIHNLYNLANWRREKLIEVIDGRSTTTGGRSTTTGAG